MRVAKTVLQLAAALTISATTVALTADDSLAGPPAWAQSAKKDKAGKGSSYDSQPGALTYRYSSYDKRGGPPPWAPAHGYRRKHGGDGDTTVIVVERDYDRPPYGVDKGFCDREVIGAILGGATGGVIGSQIGKGDTRTVAIIGGTVIGVIVGGAIGRAMDEADRTCVGQALEFVPDGDVIAWNGEADSRRFQVTPLKTFEDNNGRFCREFVTTASLDGRDALSNGIACRWDDGAWKVLR